MTSKEVKQLIEEGKVKDLYKKFEKHITLVDQWEEKLIGGDLLNEQELAYVMEKMTGVFAGLSSVAGALESYMNRTEHNSEVKGYTGYADKLRTQDASVVRANARASVNDLRDYYTDFHSYLMAADKIITMAQSRLKRLVVEGGARGVYRTGETGVTAVGQPDNVTQDPREEIVIDPQNIEWRS